MATAIAAADGVGGAKNGAVTCAVGGENVAVVGTSKGDGETLTAYYGAFLDTVVDFLTDS